MATSGSWTGSRTVTYGPQLKLSWSRTAVDIPNNRSKVKLTLELYAGYSVYFSASKSGSLHGSGFTYTGGFSGTGTKTIKTREFWVNHNSDGSKSLSVSAWLDVNISMSSGYVSRISVSGTINLDTIPRSSKLNSFSIGGALSTSNSNSVNLSLTRYSSSFTHNIYLKHGSTTIASWTGQGTPTSLSISSSEVNTLMRRMSSTTSATMTLQVYTKSGSTTIGSSVSRTATATISSTIKPSISGLSTSISGSGRDKTIGKYVQNISKVYSSFSRSAGYGASISSSSILIRKDSNHANSMTIGSYSGTSGTLISNGLYEVIATVRDSRGRTTTSRTTFTVEAYSKPKITKFSAKRDSTTDTTVNITRNGTYTSLGTDNPTDVVLSKRVSGGTWATISGGLTQHTGGSFGADKTNTGNSATTSYEFRLTVTDSFGKTAEAVQTVSTARATLDIHKNLGVGIGKMHERGVLDVDGQAHFAGDLFVNGTNLSRLVSFSSAEGIPTPIEDTSSFWQSLPQGSYFVGPGSIPNQPASYGIIVHTTQNFGSGSDFNTMWYTQSSGRVYRKSGNRSVNTEWIMIDTDSGSNSNGEWIQWGDGTQICTYQTDIYDVNATSGNIQHHYFTFPVDFVGNPAVTASGITFRGTATVGGSFDIRNVNSSQVQITANARQLSTDIDNIRGFSYIAIGRWK